MKSSQTPLVTRGTVDPAPAQEIVPADPNRFFCEIKNIDAANTFEISGVANFTYGQGHPIPPGGPFVHRGGAALYAVCANGQTAAYSLFDHAL